MKHIHKGQYRGDIMQIHDPNEVGTVDYQLRALVSRDGGHLSQCPTPTTFLLTKFN